MVVVDRLSKYNHFISLLGNFSSETVVVTFVLDIIRLHGVLIAIVTVRDPHFIRNFW